jgi:hypothetical protein
VDSREVGKGGVFECTGGPAGLASVLKRAEPSPSELKGGAQTSARSVTGENYSCVGSLYETEAINGPPKRSRAGLDNLIARLARIRQRLIPTRSLGGW